MGMCSSKSKETKNNKYKYLKEFLRSNLQNQKSVTIDLSERYISEKDILDLNVALSQCQNLNILSLSLNGYGVVKQFIKLVQILENLQNLIRLELNLEYNQINDSQCQSLANSLQKSLNIQYLELALKNNKISDEGFSQIFCALEKLTNLKALILQLGWNKINLNDLSLFQIRFQNCSKLIIFNLDLRQNQINDRIQQQLASKISKQKRLVLKQVVLK
ncbi:kinase domain protein (macronuclear) [Tetrahymena thermophila SB210]|uniref:Kinase domain protein n=1 Tax=Tetrahymena thermophila (strain SB210) TaxID=312017 RepID=W7XG27_TETTS|nr:kinase domain protein [Tetrahymena thermophila SB210]EWS75853.1 kinase domain protein [Tetrahymena thermophila SB210]|eukprot:XP_012651609.1 kinase domain protein [Tetrahymena thermophila SB210]